MPSLLVISSTPSSVVDGKLSLDIKFVEGMRYFTKLWNGDVSCLLKQRHGTFPFSQTYDQKLLPFNVTLITDDKALSIEDIRHHDMILCSGDPHEYLHLAQIVQHTEHKLVFIIEYIPETRRQIIFLDPSRSLPQKVYSLMWTMWQEWRRKKAFRKADGVQANGYPAYAHYSAFNQNIMMYLDNRVAENMLATETEMQAREARLIGGAPLRLLHSGRLEPLKGSQDLIPVARHLVSKQVDFTLDIFGTGSLETEIRNGISRYGLQDCVRLHGSVDFETELVPFARRHADIYLSCHRQSDPSCTYVENMGCGLTVIGYANRMWSSVCRESGAGHLAAMGDAEALADQIAACATDRHGLLASCRAAHHFAGKHSLETKFQRRINHLECLI